VPYRAQLGYNFVLQMCPDGASNLFGCGLFIPINYVFMPSLTCLWRIGTVPASLQRHVTCVTPRKTTKQQFASHRFVQLNGVKLAVRYAGTPSTMESEAAVGMIRRNCQPAATNKSRNCFSVRSHPLGKISIWRSRNLPGEKSLPG